MQTPSRFDGLPFRSPLRYEDDNKFVQGIVPSKGNAKNQKSFLDTLRSNIA